jgi:hypothetical protein
VYAAATVAGQVDPFSIVGHVLDGQFRVEECIGEGGFSVVYKGHHIGLGEPIAIKCLKLGGNLPSTVVESFVTRFRDESRLLYRLSQGNLNIVRSIASGSVFVRETGAMLPYMVLEWLEGQSLAADFDERRAAGKTGRSITEVLDLLATAADALTYAHAQGVVHRDLNPGNLFLTKSADGSPQTKVLDFGLAKVVSDHAIVLGQRAQTFAQMRVFSPAYAAPEQFDAALGGPGPMTDVYALANVATEALLDRPMLTGTTLGELAMKTLDPRWARTPAALGAKIGPAVEAVFKKALALSPAERFADVATFWTALEDAVAVDGAQDPTQARRTVRMQRPILEEPAAPAAPAPAASTAPDLKALKATVRMPATGQPPPATNGAPPATIARPASSVGADPDPSQPSVVVEKAPDPTRHRPTVLTRKPEGMEAPPVAPQARATVVTRAVAPEPNRSMRLLVGLLVFFAILSLGTAALFVVQRLSVH